jgi:ATP synthase protein I
MAENVMANRTNSTIAARAARAATVEAARHESRGRWEDDDDGAGWPAFKTLTREEASALRAKAPPLNPWRVIAVQGGVGVVVALLAAFITGRVEVGWSALYGAACVVVPGALMARGMTSRLSSMSAGASAVSFMLWEMVKIAVSIAMLMLAPKLVQGLSWPALLAGLVLCMKVYWLALLWRGRADEERPRTRRTTVEQR